MVITNFDGVISGNLGDHVLDIPVQRSTGSIGFTAYSSKSEIELRKLFIGHIGRKSQLAGPVFAGINGGKVKRLTHDTNTKIVDQCGRKRMSVTDHNIAVCLDIFPILSHGGICIDRVSD